MAEPRGDREDERLLDALALSLRPDASTAPSASELAAFHAVVRDVASGAAAPRRSGRARRWVAGLVVGGVVLSGGTAYATNPVAPRPVRSAAFALKLPVESPELTDAKDALADLEEELREGRRDKVAAEVEDVIRELADLSPAARRALEPRASTLLATARAFLADPRTVDERRSDDDEDRLGSGGDEGGTSGRSGSGSDGSDLDSSGSGSGGDSDPDDDSSGSGSSRTSDGDGDSSGRGSGGDSSGDGNSDGGGDSSGRGSGGDRSGGSDDDDASGVSASGGDRAPLDG